jgi:adenylosuccinate lyase
MTSRDLTENVEQLQIKRALKLVQEKAVAALLILGTKANEYEDLVITARTHHVAAQNTTLGKRLAMFGEELKYAIDRLETLIDNYPVRGVKGAVGTELDILTLLDNDHSKVREFESRIIEHLGFNKICNAVGQIYPRSYDYSVVSGLFELACSPASFAKTLRLMAGHETASEGFADGQVGSSAMPHKMNSRSCERITGFHNILRGYVTMLSGVAGNQWNEGDVSCSVVRRVALPDSFFAIDGLLETFITVLNQMEAYPAMIDKENNHYLPFLLTTTFMMEAVKKGVGRETAHAIIKEHAVQTVKDLREGLIDETDLAERLAGDERLKLSKEEIIHILMRGREDSGASHEQVEAFTQSLEGLRTSFPHAEKYRPSNIL